MFSINLGKEFQRQMKGWLKCFPEIEHCWEKDLLKINHPKQTDKFFVFQFASSFIQIQFENQKHIFKRKIFKNINEQVFQIIVFWTRTLLNEEDRSIIEPKLEKHQIAIMFCNQKYGQVLTVDKNIFNGWGNVFHIFENEEQAVDFIKLASKDNTIEIHTYNSNYEYIELELF